MTVRLDDESGEAVVFTLTPLVVNPLRRVSSAELDAARDDLLRGLSVERD